VNVAKLRGEDLAFNIVGGAMEPHGGVERLPGASSTSPDD